MTDAFDRTAIKEKAMEQIIITHDPATSGVNVQMTPGMNKAMAAGLMEIAKAALLTPAPQGPQRPQLLVPQMVPPAGMNGH